MSDKKQPDGYCKRVFGNQLDVANIRYVDELMGNPEYKEYEPVYVLTADEYQKLDKLRQFARTLQVTLKGLMEKDHCPWSKEYYELEKIMSEKE